MKLPKLALSILSLSIVTRTFACDLCGCYLPRQHFAEPKSFGLYAAVSEQFTHFGTVQFNDTEIDNPTGQYLDSSITQFVVGASFFDNRFALQVNLPMIHRSYERPEGFEIERGTESGIGDLSLVARFTVLRKEALFRASGGGGFEKDGKAILGLTREPDFTASIDLFAGIKFPTGDSSRIKEEFSEIEVEGAPESGIHGHDLALGTGSYDAILGIQASVRYKAIYFEAGTQFTIRGDGRHSYHFANDLTWSAGPGVYLYRKDSRSLGLQCIVAGESKNTDRFQGRVAEDTGVTSLYVGPRITAQFDRWSADVGVDLPVIMNTTKLQTVPDYRIRGGISVHF